MAAINNANNRDIESQDMSTVSRKDSETYQSTVLPASAIDFDPEPHKRSFRQFANPAPLGLCGFALTTFVLSLVNVRARSVTTPNIVIGLGTSHSSLLISPRVRRTCPILCRDVGVCDRKYFRRACIHFLRCVLDQLRLYFHPLLQCRGSLHQPRRTVCRIGTLPHLYCL